MAIPLRQSQAIQQLAELLYDFLPGSGSPTWEGHVSFQTVARDAGVAEFWQRGSKLPAITTLLEQTLDRRRGRFELLILTLVRAGMAYRQKKGKPITRPEIDRLNQLVAEVGFKFPDLHDPKFVTSLPDPRMSPVPRVEEQVEASTEGKRSSALAELRALFYRLSEEQNRQQAGLALEGLLNALFTLFDLDPSRPFRVTGEQIDGAFVLDGETYLVEAKWTKERVAEAPLLVFRGKIEGKSAFTRGTFISLSGFSPDAISAITRGKQPTFFMLDGYDLSVVLEGHMDLASLLRSKVRRLAERGDIFVSAKDLLKGGAARGQA